MPQAAKSALWEACMKCSILTRAYGSRTIPQLAKLSASVLRVRAVRRLQVRKVDKALVKRNPVVKNRPSPVVKNRPSPVVKNRPSPVVKNRLNRPGERGNLIMIQ